MEENVSRFVTSIIAIFLMFIFPVYTAYEKKDDISYALAVRYTQEFVDNVRRKGYITKELYDEYAKKLLVTGNTYNIDMEHEYVRYDGNYVDKTVGSATRNIELFNSEHIVRSLENEGIYAMNVNDNFNVKITNSNVTLATVIYNIVTINTSTNNVRIHVDYGGNILAEKWSADDLKYSKYGGITKNDGYSINLTVNDIDLDKEGDVVIGADDETRYYLSNNVQVGDYVAYYPNGNTSIKAVIYVPGGSLHSQVEANPATYWRVLSIDREKNKVTLISEDSAIMNYLYYYKIVNTRNTKYDTSDQMFRLLERICNEMFNNTAVVEEVRNVTKEDLALVSSNLEDELIYIGKNYLLSNEVRKKLIVESGRSNLAGGTYNLGDGKKAIVEFDVIEFSGIKGKTSDDIKEATQIGNNFYGNSLYDLLPYPTGNYYGIYSGNPGVRPVIELKEDVSIYGKGCGDINGKKCGTKDTPWQIEWPDSNFTTIGEVADVGDYVDYFPDAVSESVTIPGEISGYQRYPDDIDQTFTQQQMHWRVLQNNGDKVLLISTSSAGTLSLQGADGVNNGVNILNNICKTLYSRKDFVIARSFVIDDYIIDWINPVGRSTRSYSITYPAKYRLSSYVGNNVGKALEWEQKEIDGYITGTINMPNNHSKVFAHTYNYLAFTTGLYSAFPSGEYWSASNWTYTGYHCYWGLDMIRVAHQWSDYRNVYVNRALDTTDYYWGGDYTTSCLYGSQPRSYVYTRDILVVIELDVDSPVLYNEYRDGSTYYKGHVLVH